MRRRHAGNLKFHGEDVENVDADHVTYHADLVKIPPPPPPRAGAQPNPLRSIRRMCSAQAGVDCCRLCKMPCRQMIMQVRAVFRIAP